VRVEFPVCLLDGVLGDAGGRGHVPDGTPGAGPALHGHEDDGGGGGVRVAPYVEVVLHPPRGLLHGAHLALPDPQQRAEALHVVRRADDAHVHGLAAGLVPEALADERDELADVLPRRGPVARRRRQLLERPGRARATARHVEARRVQRVAAPPRALGVVVVRLGLALALLHPHEHLHRAVPRARRDPEPGRHVGDGAVLLGHVPLAEGLLCLRLRALMHDRRRRRRRKLLLQMALRMPGVERERHGRGLLIGRPQRQGYRAAHPLQAEAGRGCLRGRRYPPRQGGFLGRGVVRVDRRRGAVHARVREALTSLGLSGGGRFEPRDDVSVALWWSGVELCGPGSSAGRVSCPPFSWRRRRIDGGAAIYRRCQGRCRFIPIPLLIGVCCHATVTLMPRWIQIQRTQLPVKFTIQQGPAESHAGFGSGTMHFFSLGNAKGPLPSWLRACLFTPMDYIIWIIFGGLYNLDYIIWII
jgi:hypothetical protein